MVNMPKLFGTSGIRGLANIDLTPTLAVWVGLGIAAQSKAKTALTARDTRTTGSMLENALVSGLASYGTNVSSIGIAPTPVLALLTKKTGADVGVMITASHNPPQYNGIKIFSRDSMAYTEKKQNEIEKILEREKFSFAGWQNIGEIQQSDETDSYVETVGQATKLRRKWKVVVDSGCGATFDLAPRVLKTVGCKVTAINSQPDGFFPARSPEPSGESLKSVAATVKNVKADAGFAYDGDGDRVTFIDEKGEIADFDSVLAAYAAYIAEKNHGATIVTNVEASMCLEEIVQRYGGKVLRTKVGDIYLSEVIKQRNAAFGGEPCGAWIHPQIHYCPDGILSSVLLLKALEDKNKNLSEIVGKIPKYPILRENIQCSNGAKHMVVNKIGREISEIFPEKKEASKVDGVRISLENGWILIRASGTEPLVRLTVEGESLKTAENIMKRGVAVVKQFIGKVG
jgi:phosphoglucosamine mutase